MNWRKLLRRGALVASLLLATILGAVFFVLRSQWFHEFVLSTIIERAQAETGGTLKIQSWNFHLHPLVIELDGVVLRGMESPADRPLLAVDKLTVGLKVRALVDRKLELSELLIEHPVANIRVNRLGESNIPSIPPSSTKSNTTVWSLVVSRTSLNRGEIFYNDKKLQVDADLDNLKTEIHYDRALTQYSGSLAYQNGTLKYANYSSLPHALQARFSATPAGASLDSLLLSVGSSKIDANGQLVNYVSPDVSAKYDILIHTQDFAFLAPEVSPAGDLRISGKLQYHDAAGQSFLHTFSADGTVASQDLQAVTPQARLAINELAAGYRLANGDLALNNIAANLVGGRLQAELTVHDVQNLSRGEFRAELERASIESARLGMRRAELRRMPVTGTVNTSVRGTWDQDVRNIQARGSAQVTAAVWKSAAERKSAIPVDANIHFSYEGRNQSIRLRQTSVQIPAASAVINGEISKRSNLQIHAVSGDLRQLAQLVVSLRSGSGESIPPVDISGRATLDAVLEGSLAYPSLTGQLAAQNIEVQGSRWKTAQIALSANPSQLNISRASLVSANQGNLSLTAQAVLRNWAYLPAGAIHANLTARNISLSELEHLGSLKYPVAGNLSADLSLHGSQLHPSGHGSLQIDKASAYDQPIQDLSVQFRTEDDSIDSSLILKTSAGNASGTFTFTPGTKAYSANLQAPEIALQKLRAVATQNLPIVGTVAFSARGSGTFEDPQLDVTLQAPTLQIRETSLNNVNAVMNLDQHRAHLSLNSNVGLTSSASQAASSQAYVRADANVDLVGNFHTQASIDTSLIPLAPFLAVYAPSVPEGFKGETEVHASVSGPLKDRANLVAHLTLPTLTGAYQSLQFSNVSPIHADYADSVLVLQPAEIRGTQTSIRVQGRIPVGNNEPINVNARGNVNLQLLAMFDSDIQSRGSADFDVRATGNLPHANVRGQMHIKDAAFTTSTAPVGISRVNGTLDLSDDKIKITALTGEIGGGQVSVGGSIALQPSLGFNLALQGRGVRVLYPAGVRSVLDADLTFTGGMKAAALRGRTLIQSLNFTPDFSLSTISAQFNTPSVPPVNQTFSDNITLAVSVQSAQNLTARSSQLNLSGMANLRIAGTVADPVVIGRIDLSSGELFFMSNRYELQRGIVSFNDPDQTRPVLNVQATTTVEQYSLTLTLTGPLDRLSTAYVSNPALPTADIISLIYRGQTVEEASAAGTSTDSILAGGIASEFSSGLQNLTGISSLQIDPLLGGNGTNPSARIAVQQRVTKNFLFTFSTDVTQPESDIVLGQYQLTPHWSVSVERDQLGGVSIDGQLRTKF